VSLALTWSHRLCLLRVLLCGGLCYRLFPFQALGKATLPRVVRPGPRLPKPCGRRPLAARGPPRFPFNVKWRFSAPAGDVEESKLCLFSVIMPAKCVSSISPRFHYRRVAFCFLPLAAILESSQLFFFLCDHPEWLSKCRPNTQTMVTLCKKPTNSLEEPKNPSDAPSSWNLLHVFKEPMWLE
jgi:hypothetical protein